MAFTVSLTGKTAVITGSNSGIGLGIAWELARAGANIVLNSFTDRKEDHALADQISEETGVKARYIQADMSKGDECRGLIEKAGVCDILVNNAGIVQPIAAISDSDPADWRYNLEVNLIGPFNLITGNWSRRR